MKRISNLYGKIISIENLQLADKKARRGKQHSPGVQLHDKDREGHILALHEALKNKTFKTSPYEVFKVYSPKERDIYRLPYYPDRIVHHAIMNVIEPIWTKTFTYNTYSCIKGRGISACARRVEKIIHGFADKPLYCLKTDMTKFYPSIDHQVMKALVRRKIKDKDLLWLLDDIIDSTDGLPIGSYISQFLSNLYMCYMMHWINERLPYSLQESMGLPSKPRLECTEYVDDLVFFSDSKEILHAVFAALKKHAETNLHLSIKGNHQIFPIARNRHDRHGRALDYVGFQFFREQKLMRKSIKKRLCRKAARLNKRTPPLTAKAYRQAIAPWLGWAKHSNSKHLLKTVIKRGVP